MKNIKRYGLYLVIILILLGIGEIVKIFFVYSVGTRVGTIVQVEHTGYTPSYEGTLQVGSQGSNIWQFSIVNRDVVKQVQEAADHQWRVKLTYHEFQRSPGRNTHFNVIKVERVE